MRSTPRRRKPSRSPDEKADVVWEQPKPLNNTAPRRRSPRTPKADIETLVTSLNSAACPATARGDKSPPILGMWDESAAAAVAMPTPYTRSSKRPATERTAMERLKRQRIEELTRVRAGCGGHMVGTDTPSSVASSSSSQKPASETCHPGAISTVDTAPGEGDERLEAQSLSQASSEPPSRPHTVLKKRHMQLHTSARNPPAKGSPATKTRRLSPKQPRPQGCNAEGLASATNVAADKENRAPSPTRSQVIGSDASQVPRQLSDQERLRIEINKRKALAKLRRKQSMQRQLVQGQPQALSQQSSSSQPVANAIHHSQQNKAAVISQTSTFNSDPKNQAKEEANPSDNQNKKPLRQPLAPLFVATRNAKSASLVNTGTGANKHQGVNAVSAGRSHHMNIR